MLLKNLILTLNGDAVFYNLDFFCHIRLYKGEDKEAVKITTQLIASEIMNHLIAAFQIEQDSSISGTKLISAKRTW